MIVDTNALSALVDGDSAVGDIPRRQPRAAIPVIVLGDFRHGITQSRHRKVYENWFAAELPNFDVLGVTAEPAIEHAALRVELRRNGRPMPANHARIAALALQHRLLILSRDQHFEAAPGLRSQAW